MTVIRRSSISPLLVGRAEELEALKNALALAVQGKGVCLLISGEAGIGKSRLTAEACDLAARDGFALLRGACFEQDRTFPYGPWIDALRQSFARLTPGQIQETLGDFAAEIVKLTPELAALIPSIRPSPELSPEAEKRRLFEALARFIAGLAAARPLMIVIEDLHWGDETSLELMFFLARRFAALPVILAATFRPDDQTPQLKRFLAQVIRERLALEIQLKPLSRLHTAEMIQAIFKIERPIQLEFLDLIVPLTGGNPFFLEEVLQSLVETGGIYWTGTGWERRSLVELQVPHSIRDAVQQRLEPLSPAARQFAILIAVVGHHASFELLQALAKLEENELLLLVKELVEAHLVNETSPDQFAFRHELARQAVYEGLMQRERKRLHRMIAETIEVVFAGLLDFYLPDLALHFYRSGEWEKTLQYAWQAGEKAQALHSPREALEHFQHALEAREHLSLPTPIGLYRSRALAAQTLGDFELAQSDFKVCLQAARSAGEGAAEWQALLDLALLLEGRDYRQAGEYNRQALALARRLDDPARIGRSLNRLTIWHANMNQIEAGLLCNREALSIFEVLQDRRAIAETLGAQGNLHFTVGDFQAGSHAYHQALQLFHQEGDLQGIFECQINLGLCGALDLYFTEIPTMTLAEAQRSVEEALAIAHQMSSRSDEALASIRLAMILRARGEYSRALELAVSATDLAEELDHSEWASFGWGVLGQIKIDLLDFGGGQADYERSLTRVERSGNVAMHQMTAATLGQVYIRQGRLDQAEAVLAAALQLDAPVQAVPHRLVHYAWAVLAQARGDPAQALRIVDRLLAPLPEPVGDASAQIPLLARQRARALAALGREAEAAAGLEAAAAAALRLGALPLAWRIQLSLARLHRSLGNLTEAETALAASRAIVTALAEKISAPDLRDGFLQRAQGRFAPLEETSPAAGGSPQDGPLTAREQEMVALIAAGKSNGEIAGELVLSKRTVEKHISNILSKLALSSRVQIVTWALEKNGKNLTSKSGPAVPGD